MKKHLLLTSCFLLLTSVLFCQALKKVKITDIEEYIKKSDHPIVVSFWATWCAPCVEEIPWLQSAVEKNKKNNVELVLVSLDFPNFYPKKITDVIKEKKISGTLFWLADSDPDYFCPKIDAKWDGAIPATLLINNKTGYRKFFNRQITERQVEPEINSLVK